MEILKYTISILVGSGILFRTCQGLIADVRNKVTPYRLFWFYFVVVNLGLLLFITYNVLGLVRFCG